MENSPMRVRLQEVALEAGYSIGTVSRAISRPERLKTSTVEHVREVAERLGYRPNFIARTLRMGMSRCIHVITPSLVSLFPEIIRGIESAAHELGYSLIIVPTARDAERQRRHLTDVAAGRADGAILLGINVPDRVVTGARSFPPCVSVLQGSGRRDVPSIRMDDAQAAKLVVEHLIALGHRKIFHICGDDGAPVAELRRKSFIMAMKAAGLKAVCIPGRFTPEGGRMAMLKLLETGERPTAVYGANDEIAVGVLTALRESGLRAPRDMSVVGHDDQRLSRIYAPAITTVQIPAYDIGRKAMAMLQSVMRKEAVERDILLPAQLVARTTTAGPPAGN